MPVLNTLPIYPPPSGAADGISISGHSSAANDGTLIELTCDVMGGNPPPRRPGTTRPATS